MARGFPVIKFLCGRLMHEYVCLHIEAFKSDTINIIVPHICHIQYVSAVLKWIQMSLTVTLLCVSSSEIELESCGDNAEKQKTLIAQVRANGELLEQERKV